jgi:hypothetical protein
VVVKAQAIEFLFPTQAGHCPFSLPRSASVCDCGSALQLTAARADKISAYRTLQEFGVPQPETVIVESRDDLLRIDTFPAFVERPIGTASSGVRRTSSRSELNEVSKVMGVGEYELLVQTQADGPLAMVQAIRTTAGWWRITPTFVPSKEWEGARPSRKASCSPGFTSFSESS